MATLDSARLRQAAPILVPLAILIGGWALLVHPASAERAQIVQSLSQARQRAAAIRASINEPIPPPSPGDPGATFERRIAAGDATAAVLEQVARLASEELAGELMIETGPRVAVTAATGGPQAGQPTVDPRLALFDTSLTYSPITMSFETEYKEVGQFLWRLRDLATIVEIRHAEITPQPERVRPMLHVSVTMFAYAKPAGARAVGARP